MHLQLPLHNPKEVSADLAFEGSQFTCVKCQHIHTREEYDDTIKVSSVTSAKESLVPLVPDRYEVIYVFTCPNCKEETDLGKRITDTIHTSDFNVYVPGENKEKIKIPIVVTMRFDPDCCDWILTTEAIDLIGETKHEYLTAKPK